MTTPKLEPWPLFGLTITTPRLVLRPPTDDDFPALLAAIEAGIHDPAEMPFLMAWTDKPRAIRERESVQWWWQQRAGWKPDEWSLGLAVFLDGRAVGIQDVDGKQYAALRRVSTGSWLTRDVQGQGLGKEMRAAVLTLAFDGLGAIDAASEAFTDNAASLGVSRRLGYRDNGVSRALVRDQVRISQGLLITRDDWQAQRSSLPTATVDGLEPCREMFGI